jgi:hypothetical protein
VDFRGSSIQNKQPENLQLQRLSSKYFLLSLQISVRTLQCIVLKLNSYCYTGKIFILRCLIKFITRQYATDVGTYFISHLSDEARSTGAVFIENALK